MAKDRRNRGQDMSKSNSRSKSKQVSFPDASAVDHDGHIIAIVEDLKHMFPPFHVSRRSKMDRRKIALAIYMNQADHSMKADCCKSSHGGRHTDRHMDRHNETEYDVDDDAKGFDGVRG